MTSRAPRHHTAHFTPYHEGNSRRGILRAEREGYDWIDLDCLLDKTGRAKNEHWGEPLAHGFYDPLGEMLRGHRLRFMTREQVDRIRAHGNPPYRIHDMVDQIHFAAEHDLNVENEFKFDARFGIEEIVEPLISAARAAYGTGWRKHYLVKTLTSPGSVEQAIHRLSAAHRLGANTILICQGADRFRKIDHPALTWTRGNVRT